MLMSTGATTPISGAVRGGRGARERILRAAEELFYTRGIHATGVAALIEAAHVSPRTFYAHFPTKNALVEEYLRRFESETPIAAEAELERDDLSPAQRLLAIFNPLEGDPSALIRGCPFHNAVIEGAGELPRSPASRNDTSTPSASASWPQPQRPERPTRRPLAGNSP